MADTQEVTRHLFQQAKQLAEKTGWSVFVKVVSPTETGEFYGTGDLTEKYRTDGLKFEAGENETTMGCDNVVITWPELEGLREDNGASVVSPENVQKESEKSTVEELKPSEEDIGDGSTEVVEGKHEKVHEIDQTEKMLQEVPESERVSQRPNLLSVLATIKERLGQPPEQLDTKLLDKELTTAMGEVQKYMLTPDDDIKVSDGVETESRSLGRGMRTVRAPRWTESYRDWVPEKEQVKQPSQTPRLGRRKRGRPKKHILEEGDEEHVISPQKVVRRRGRPRKYPEYAVDYSPISKESKSERAMEIPEKQAEEDCVTHKSEGESPDAIIPESNEQSLSLIVENTVETKDQSETTPRHSSRRRGRPRKYEEFEGDISEATEKNKTRKSKKSLYICKECGEAFASVSYLETHMNRHLGIKPHTCTICQKSFLHSNSLKIHKVVHSGEKSYVCDVCGKAFAQASTLRDHKVTHTKERPHKCKVCSKGFTQRGSLLSHIRIHTGEKPYKCDLCGKAFTQANGLRTHKLAHSGEKPYKCTECDKAFNTIFKLKAHKPIHADKMPYPCDKCEKAFSMLCQLRNHNRKDHLKERPYLCEECGKSFADTKTMYHHKKVHTGTRQYKCKFCEKSFYNQSSVVKHERIHTGEKPFVCDECGKAFNRADNLRSHKKIHSNEPNEHACMSCDKKFRVLSYLRKHEETAHSVNGLIHEEKIGETSPTSMLQTPVSLQPATTTTTTTIILEQGIGGTDQVEVQGQEALSTVASTGTTYVLQVDPSVSLPVPSWDSQVEVPRYSVQTVHEVLDSEVQTAAAMLLSATQPSLTDRH